MNEKNYIEMPFKKAYQKYPELFIKFPVSVLLEFFSDDDYIVRIDKIHKCAEIGYPSDLWAIN